MILLSDTFAFYKFYTPPFPVTVLQADLQEALCHLGVYNELNKEVQGLLTRILSTAWEGAHTCQGTPDDDDDAQNDMELVDCVQCEVSR